MPLKLLVLITVQHFILHIQIMPNIVQASLDGIELAATHSKAKKRWHQAFTTLRCYKAFLSLANDEEGKFLHKFSRSSSYTIIDVEPAACLSEINRLSITKLVREQNRDWLHEFGWIEGVLSALETNAENGIHGDTEDITCRKEAFGSNKYPKPTATSFFHFVVEAFRDPMILVLLLCAVISLGFGIKKKGLGEGWYDGGSKFVAVLVVITVSAAIDLWADREFHKMIEARLIDVVRSRRRQQISMPEIVVGDVVFLETGVQVPADGLFLDGYSLLVDESKVTRQTDLVEVDYLENPFLFADTKVANGYARMLVTAVGMNTRSKSHNSFEWTVIQIQLKYLSSLIGTAGLSIAFLVLSVSLVRYFAGNMYNEEGNKLFISGKTKIHHVLEDIVGILATPVMIASRAIPEGFSLTVTITLAYLMKIRMIKGEALLRIPSCQHSICSAISFFRNTLKLDQMNVSKFRIGQNSIKKVTPHLIAPNVLELLHQGIGLNPTQFPSKSLFEFSRNPTERGICNWAIFQLSMDIEKLKESCTILQIEAFDFEEEKRGVLIRKENDNTIHSHRKGAPGAILATCSHYYETDGTIGVIDARRRGKLMEEIEGMTANGLRCIAFVHKQMSKDDYDQHLYQVLKEDNFILLGLVGLENPYLSGLRKSVEACRYDGVTIRMLTEENISTARAVAAECGILEHYPGEVVEGADFRNYMLEARMDRVQDIRVMASASPSDKFFVVQQLKLHGHVIVITGRDTWDALLQSEADTKLCLGIQATNMTKHIRDIVIVDDHIPSVVTPLSWGEGTYHDIQIFTQFQLTMCSVSLVIDSVTAISARESPTMNIVSDVFSGKVPYPVLQLLWVKLIVSTLAAIALIREQPFKGLMQNPPRGQGRQAEPLITNIMWRDIIAQALYQISILLTIHFKGQLIFRVNAQVKDTFIFNTFVLFQVCNMFNARKLKKNIWRSKLFWGIIGIIIVLQVVIVECLKEFADAERLDWGQWGSCIGIAAASWPMGRVVERIPTPEKPFFRYLKGHKQKNKVL